jgi:hypothetical protein
VIAQQPVHHDPVFDQASPRCLQPIDRRKFLRVHLAIQTSDPSLRTFKQQGIDSARLEVHLHILGDLPPKELGIPGQRADLC